MPDLHRTVLVLIWFIFLTTLLVVIRVPRPRNWKERLIYFLCVYSFLAIALLSMRIL